MPSKTVMVVDDSESDLLFTRIMLERCGAGFQVLEVECAQDALARLAQRGQAVCLILLDINMPRMNGWEFLEAYEALAGEGPTQPVVVMLTSSPDPDDRDRALASPLVRGYLEKPLDLTQAAALARFLPGGDGGG